MQTDVADHRHARHIPKADPLERQLAARSAQYHGIRRVLGLGRLIEDLEHALCARQGALNLVIEVCQLAQRRRETARIANKGGDGADRRQPLNRHPAPQARQNGDVGVAHHAHQRRHQHRIGLCARADALYRVIGLVKVLQHGSLLAIGHDDALPAEHLFQAAIEQADACLQIAETTARVAPDRAHHQHHQRENQH